MTDIDRNREKEGMDKTNKETQITCMKIADRETKVKKR
jgi:hypothetical protein